LDINPTTIQSGQQHPHDKHTQLITIYEIKLFYMKLFVVQPQFLVGFALLDI
jgi:hypothetical protein